MMLRCLLFTERMRSAWPVAAGLVWVGLFSFDAVAQTPDSHLKPGENQWEFLDNGIIRVGVNKSRGAGIGFLGETGTGRNVLNYCDHGRFIQQSYDGAPDGADRNGKHRQDNPIHGGTWCGKDTGVVEFRKVADSGLYARVELRHRASGKPCPEAVMEQWITLNGPVAHVCCRLTYTGKEHGTITSQERPAVFVDAELQNLVYVQRDKLVRRLPGWPNESGDTSEDWVACVDDRDWGIGLLTPGTSTFTCDPSRGVEKSDPRGAASPYVAAIRKLRLRSGQVVDYEFYLTPGSLDQIRHRFAALRDSNQEFASADDDRPSIIMLFADDWGYGDLGLFRNLSDVKTPHLDRLSEQGVLFTDAYITAPQCSPSRAGLLTGRYQQRFGFDSIPDCPLPLNQSTIADRLKSAGYVTGMVGKWHLEPNALSLKWARKHQPGGILGRRVRVRRDLAMPFFPGARGFNEFFMGQSRRYWCNFDLAGNDLERDGQVVEKPQFRVDVQTEAGLAFIRRNRSQPFFLYLAYYAPHVPLEAPDRYLDRFPGRMPERRRTGLAMINAVDEGVGRIRQLLRDEGIADNTLIMFTSDNGAPLGAHAGQVMADILPVDKPGPAWDGSRNDPLTGEKGMLAEGGIRVPMIWSWPARLPVGKTVSDPVISLDMTASALAAAGVSDRSGLDGVDLIPCLTGEVETPAERDLYWRFWSQAAIRSGDWKYIVTGSGRELLFNLRRDKEERHSVLAEQREHGAAMREKLSHWADQLRPPGLPSTPLNRQEMRWYGHYFQTPDQVPFKEVP